MAIIACLAIAGFACYVMTPDERARFLGPALACLRMAKRAGLRVAAGAKWLMVGLVSGNPWAVTAVVLATVFGVHVRSQGADWRALTDVRPEIERLVAIEEHTARAYDAAVAQFQLGALSAEALAGVIKTSLIPEYQEVTTRLRSLGRIRAEHRSLLSQAQEILQLRSESWRLRAEALEKRNMSALKLAEGVERVSLKALERVRRGDRQ